MYDPILGCVRHGDLNSDGALAPGDALCVFQIYLNKGVLPATCDVAGAICETHAADVNCDGAITPGDALDMLLPSGNYL